jgi:autoinducer 2-degrading protein
MFVVCVSIQVDPKHVEAFIAATLENARNTRTEPGNTRFDVLRRIDDPACFTLVEAYPTAEDFAAHQRTAHYLRWKETVAPWMAVPRVGVKHTRLFPADLGGSGE